MGSGTTEAAQQEGIEPLSASAPTPVAPPPEPQAADAEPAATPPGEDRAAQAARRPQHQGVFRIDEIFHAEAAADVDRVDRETFALQLRDQHQSFADGLGVGFRRVDR